MAEAVISGLNKALPNDAAVNEFVQAYTGGFTDTVEPVATGEVSQAYFFETPNGERVLRISENAAGFKKDAFAAEHFGGSEVHIPAMRAMGEFENGQHYAVSDRLPGRPLSRLDLETRRRLAPSAFATLEAIHHTPPAGEGSGLWDPDTGNAPDANWHETILNVVNIYPWERLFEEGMLSRETFNTVFQEVQALLPYCPENIRQLVHTDVNSNILANEEGITGVVDWAWSVYGDGLYDVAILEMHDPEVGYAEAFREYCAARGQVPENLEERLQCYSVMSSLLGLGFSAIRGESDRYERVIHDLQRIGVDVQGHAPAEAPAP